MEKSRSGFTLLELIVTLGIFVILGGITLINLSSRRSLTDLTDTSTKISATLREAQSDSMAQKNGMTWGVHFSNPSSSDPSYALFSGSYSTGTVVGQYPLPNDVAFSVGNVPSGGTLDITFTQVTGASSTSTSLVLYLISSGNNYGGSSFTISTSTSIIISSVGLVSN